MISTNLNETEISAKSIKVNAEKLPSGLYFVKLSDGYFIQTKKIIVTH
jgi:hypothetical protein